MRPTASPLALLLALAIVPVVWASPNTNDSSEAPTPESARDGSGHADKHTEAAPPSDQEEDEEEDDFDASELGEDLIEQLEEQAAEDEEAQGGEDSDDEDRNEPDDRDDGSDELGPDDGDDESTQEPRNMIGFGVSPIGHVDQRNS